MISIKYAEKEFYYTVRLSGLNDNIITGKFDTGAVTTIITTKKLGILPKSFYSATDGEMKGYLVKAKDVMLYNTKLKSFYYYLILDNNLNKALLGDDFISCCTFHHQPKGDIVITAIDMDLYLSSYENFVDCIDISEIL